MSVPKRWAPNQLVTDTALIGGGLLLGRALGFIRELLLARSLGVTPEMDALSAALNLSDVLSGFLFGGAAAAVVTPRLTHLLVEEGDAGYWRLSQNLVWVAAVLLSALTLLGVIGARAVAWIVAPGLPPPTFELAVQLIRISLTGLLFSGVAFVLAPILNARRQFMVPALTTAAQNALLIAVVLFLVPVFGVTAVAWGAVAGGAVRVLLLLANARRQGMQYRFACDWREPHTRAVLAGLLPAILGFSILDLNAIVARNFASRLGEGAVAAYNYADKLLQLPLAVFASAVALAVLPSFSAYMKREDWDGMRTALRGGIASTLALTLPASALLMVLNEQIVALVFRRGAFQEEAVSMTAQLLFWLAAGIPLHGINLILMRVFHSRLDLRTPLWLSLATFVLNIGLNVVLTAVFGLKGVAIATTATAAVFTALLSRAVLREAPLAIREA